MQQNILTSRLIRLDRWRRQRHVQTVLTIILVLTAPVLAVATAAVLGLATTTRANQLLSIVGLLDIIYILLLMAIVARRLARTIAARRSRSAGSRLHFRLTRVFTLMALAPTVLVAIFSTLIVNFGVEGWFSNRVRNVVSNSLTAAQAYEAEHRETLKFDAETLAVFIESQRNNFPLINDALLRDILARGQGAMQNVLQEAFIIDGLAELVVRGENSYRFDYEPPDAAQITAALNGEMVIVEDLANSEYRALVSLEGFPDRYLYVTRDVDGKILSLLDETRETVKLYQQLEADRGTLLFEFAMIYLGFAIIVILAAVLLGLWFAERLARPVGRLAHAAQRVGEGDLDVSVAEGEDDDEIATLARTFNRMTKQVRGQRDALIAVNEETESRRRLFDSVLGSVTAGVIGLNPEGRIEIINPSAESMLELAEGQGVGQMLADIVPEFSPLFARVKQPTHDVVQGAIHVSRTRINENLLVRMSARRGVGGDLEGYVVTFDDVTDLVSAQRMAAWGDVARRIAHEIKNPLTPIQLSAERLKRKFGPLVGDERANLDQYADVIVRQTNDLRRIVDEFSKFARMPAPEPKPLDMIELLRGAVLLQQSARPELTIKTDIPAHPVRAVLDGTQMSQALTNLLKNAAEAIDTKVESGVEDFAPELRVIVKVSPARLEICIQDNGIGLPKDTARLFEPYVTTRDKGTGLGLSIVRKIIEDHHGTLELRQAPAFSKGAPHGAEACIVLPLPPDAAPELTAEDK